MVEFAQIVKLDILNICFFAIGNQFSANLHSPHAVVPLAAHLDITTWSLEGIDDDPGNHITWLEDVDERGLQTR